MIEIKQEQDRERAAELIAKSGLNGDALTVLTMSEKEKRFGSVILSCEGEVLYILALIAGSYDFITAPDMETTFILDSLTRSAASYGEAHNACKIRTGFPDFFDFFAARGFQIHETYCDADMGVIVKYS